MPHRRTSSHLNEYLRLLLELLNGPFEGSLQRRSFDGLERGPRVLVELFDPLSERFTGLFGIFKCEPRGSRRLRPIPPQVLSSIRLYPQAKMGSPSRRLIRVSARSRADHAS